MKDAAAKFYAFLDRPLYPSARVALALLVVPAGFALTEPLWRISMEAPQYPRGLYFEIYSHRLVGGDDGQHIAEINTLNHYIGMKPIEPESIPELGWMPFAIGVLILLALRVAAIGNVRGLVDLSVVIVYVLGFAAARFLYFLYTYGHDLDPRAAVTIEPFWPVIIGTKQIANFTTHGTPLLGTYLLLVFAVGAQVITVVHLVRGRRDARRAAANAAPQATT